MKHPSTCSVELSDWLRAWGQSLLVAADDADVERRVRQIEGRERGRKLIGEVRAARSAGRTLSELSREFGEPVAVIKRLLG